MTWTNKSDLQVDPVSKKRTGNGRVQSGHQGNRVDPTDYSGTFGMNFPRNIPKLPNGAYQPTVDLPNTWIATRVALRNFPGARNQAWGNFVAGVHQGSATLGTALAESKEGIEMVALRAGQCYRAYRDLRRGNFRDFLRTLGIGAKRKHRNKFRNAISESSSLWLEYSFGWKPLFVDMYDGVKAVGQPVPGGRVSGSGAETLSRHYNPGYGGVGEDLDVVVHCKQQADVFITNPNLYLWQQLGLANPALVAWELVPFSFVADWVLDVGTCLGSFTDLLGCSVHRPFCTYFVRRGAVEYTWRWDATRTYRSAGRISAVSRRTGLAYPLPNFSFQHNIGGSLKRAANAVSLLGQILTK